MFLLHYQRRGSSSLNSIPALGGGSCFIFLPKIDSGKKELQRKELFGILGLNIDDGGDGWIHF